ncbi:MAG: hypothetical protein LC624_08735, partial [Halobacteriales archaeon]|nr:hypothetical protein [Halobacteriales archaeon]
MADRVIDTNLDGTPESFSVGRSLAPGCTDDAGRQPSGLCGLWSVGVGNGNAGELVPHHTAGTQGMSGNAAPGAFTPTKNSVVRFLDGRIDQDVALVGGTGGAYYVDYNHAIGDSPLAAALGVAGAQFPTMIPGGSAIWAWYGQWEDKNGNGVIDMLEVVGSPTDVDATNEFVWIGNCLQFQGLPAEEGQQFCTKDPGTTMPVWIYPGNHHAICYGLVAGQYCGTTNPLSWGDLPGRQVPCFVDTLAGHLTPFVCAGQID